MKKSPQELDRDIAAYLASESTLYWPGGSGGGGSRKRVKGKPVMRPHARTSSSCRWCTRFHTTAEHELEAGGDQRAPMHGEPSERPRARGKATRTARATKPAKPTKSTNLTKARPSPSVRSRLAVVGGAVKAIRGRGRFGDRKVFVAALWRRVRRKLGMSLDEFKQWLFAQHRAGALQLARADLVSAMDPNLVASSEIRVPGAEFHFVVDPEPKELR